MIVLIDNYDSFVYNLYQFLAETGQEVRIARNDRITPEEVLAMAPDGVVISPGPGKPSEAGVCIPLIRKLSGKIPLLGVCLGHQAIGQSFGAEVVGAKRIMHGKISEITHDGKGLFEGFHGPFKAVRYHSLALREETLPKELVVTARAEDGEIMGVRHRELLIEGIQDHPESIMTPGGKRQIANFLRAVEARRNAGV